MIGWVREFATSWAAKVLLVVLVVSFGVWGVRLTAFGGFAVAEIGDESISPQDFQREFRSQVAQFQRQYNFPINQQQAVELGLHVAAHNRLLLESAMAQEAAKLGIEAPDATVVSRIQNDPSFHLGSGGFSPEAYERALASNGFRKTEFEEQERRRATEDVLQTAATLGITAPRLTGELLWKREAEARKIGYLTLTLEQIAEPADPGDGTLRAHHEAHADRFTRPELRKLELLWLRPETLADPAEVSDDQIQAAYDAAGDRYNRAEQRNLEQLAFPDRDAAEAAADRVRGGATLAMISAEMGEGDVALGYVSKAQLAAFTPALAEAAFAPDADGLIGPIESDGEFYLMRVAGKIDGRSTPIAEVRDALALEIATAKARRETGEIANGVEDMIASDLPFAEIAEKQRGLSLSEVEIDAKGQDGAGRRVEGIPEDPEFLTTVFDQLEGEELSMSAAPDGSYWKAIVAEITPAALRPFESARDAVLADWRLDQKRRLLVERARDAQLRLETGKSLEATATALGVEPQYAEGVTRLSGGGLPKEAVEAVFAIPAERAVGAATIVDRTPDKLVLTTLETIAPDPAAAEEEIAARRADASRAVSADALALYRQGVVAQFPSETNWGMIQQTLAASGG